MMDEVDYSQYKKSRAAYVAEAGIEYFISLQITGAVLAVLLAYLGVSDSLTGIMSSFVSLACISQLLSIILFRGGRVKKTIITLHLINQTMFLVLYFIPFLPLSSTTKIALFVVMLLGGYIISYIIAPPKFNWLMSFVAPNKIGSFAAIKEAVSLLGGMVFSFGLGMLIDHYKAADSMKTLFIISAIIMAVFIILHTVSLLVVKESQFAAVNKSIKVSASLKTALKDRTVIKIIILVTLWNCAEYISVSFFYTYQIKELGFSFTLVSVIVAISSVVRALMSGFWGHIADKYSFQKSLLFCMIIMGVGFFLNCFTAPSNGIFMFLTFQILRAIAFGGINSGMQNIMIRNVPPDRRVPACALQGAIAGTVGFFMSMVGGALLENIQSNGNKFIGMNIFAQQVLSFISGVLVVVVIIYLLIAFKKRKN